MKKKLESKLTKQQFANEMKGSISDLENKVDCCNWWGAHIDAYIEDGLINKNARKWSNPFINKFKE